MEPQSIHQSTKLSQLPTTKPSIQGNTEAFSKALNHSATQLGHAILAANETHKQRFKQKKTETDSVHTNEAAEEENEPLHKTVHKIAKKLKALAELERRFLGL